MKKSMDARGARAFSPLRVAATICTILMMVLSILSFSRSHSPNVSNYDREMASGNIPLVNESLPAIGWSEDIRLTNDPASSHFPDIASEGRNVHIVWEHYGNETGLWKYYLMYKRSTNGGLTWDDGLGNVGRARMLCDLGPYIPIVSARIGVNGSNVHIAYYGRYTDKYFWPTYMNSTTNGETWSEPRTIGNKTDGEHGSLDIAVEGSNVHIAWLYRPRDDISKKHQVYYSMSSDGGVSWSNATKMTSLPKGSQRPIVEVEGNNVHLVYLDGDLHKLYYRRSLDNGKTWDDGIGNVGLQRLLFSDLNNYSYMSQLDVSDGRVHIAWDREIPHVEWSESEGIWRYVPYYQMLYMNSEDNGGNWSAAQVLVDHTDVPHWGREPYGHVVSVNDIEATGTNVHMLSVDTRDYKFTSEIYYKRSIDGGKTWTGDIRLTYSPRSSFWPRVAIGDEQIHVVWLDKRDDNNPYTDLESETYYKRYPAFGPPPPTNLSARLEGASFENVNISWEAPEIGENESSVHHYDIFHGEAFDWNGYGYTLLDSVQASNESSYYYVHVGAGEGDPKNYFYYVSAANSTNHSSRTHNQAGKFTRPLSEGPNILSLPLIQSDESIENFE